MKRWHIFCVQIAWLIGLGVLAELYFGQGKLHMTLGPVPVGVVWFGALGAVLISLTGIVEHAGDWDPGFNLWHLSRPLVGAALAVVAVLILQAGVLAAGKEPSGTAADGTKNLLISLLFLSDIGKKRFVISSSDLWTSFWRRRPLRQTRR